MEPKAVTPEARSRAQAVLNTVDLALCGKCGSRPVWDVMGPLAVKISCCRGYDINCDNPPIMGPDYYAAGIMWNQEQTYVKSVRQMAEMASNAVHGEQEHEYCQDFSLGIPYADEEAEKTSKGTAGNILKGAWEIAKGVADGIWSVAMILAVSALVGFGLVAGAVAYLSLMAK